MKLARFEYQGQLSFGVLDEETNEFITIEGDPLYSLANATDPNSDTGGFASDGTRIPVDAVRLLAPVIPRSKVVGFGRNYAAHAEELGNEVPGEPLMFLKPNTAIVGPGHPIVLPAESQQVEHEVELAVVIGKVARNVPADRVDEVIFGYTVANDVTARDLQQRDGQWARAKGFDSFCPLGPYIDTDYDIASGGIGCQVNGVTRQESNLSLMERSVGELVSYASSVFTLLPGDVVLTGTPAGVSALQAGDEVTCAIESLGRLTNPVVAAQ
ncbi:fumarylacetoacetate hydrolase family protein [Gulosibacter bifidus]|uniref:Fumarylacetoacetate hydrolase family protein n=1 Tax=Gulosibacter bifidus TaxID=272239 RepID=A0ABW5RJ27_9MICO|nr:fumarylacetoacetate hydrolase family protein [Gulosibacter bifidus]